MSIDGIQNSLSSMISIQQDDVSREKAEGDSTASLSKLTDSISLSSIDPKLRSVLEDISDRGGNVVDALEGNIDTLQEGFLDTLHTRLGEAGVNLDEKITLRLNESDALEQVGNHPDKETIDGVLKESPDIKEAFEEIATQSELVRDIKNIRKVVRTRGGAAQYAEAAAEANTGHDTYQLSIKGSFSHFYFAKD